MVYIDVNCRATVHITADEWELYTSHPGAREAAREINSAIEAGFDDYNNRNLEAVRAAALKVMRKHVDLGALDSEPIWKLEQVLAKLFPPRIDELPED